MKTTPSVFCLILGLAFLLPLPAALGSVDILLAIDRSLSMNANDRNRDSIKGAELFGEMLTSRDRLALMIFAQDALLLRDFTPLSAEDSRAGFTAALDSIRMDGTRTDFETLLRAAERSFRKRSASSRAEARSGSGGISTQ